MPTGFEVLRLHATADSVGVHTLEAEITGGLENDTDPANDSDSTSVTVTGGS